VCDQPSALSPPSAIAGLFRSSKRACAFLRVQVRIMVARLAEAKEDALERALTHLAENARLQVVDRRATI